MPEMRYVDTPAKKHAYTIIGINRAGIPSQPSAKAVVDP
jgi:hypothetical protein